MEWTPKDQETALAEGWGVFENSDHGLRIERNDSAARFDCDAAAVAYVAYAAAQGYRLAKRAVAFLAYEHAVSDAAEVDAESAAPDPAAMVAALKAVEAQLTLYGMLAARNPDMSDTAQYAAVRSVLKGVQP